MTPIRPGQPTPTPRPGTGPETPPGQAATTNPEREQNDAEKEDKLHPQEISREKMESEMPADPDPDDPVSP